MRRQQQQQLQREDSVVYEPLSTFTGHNNKENTVNNSSGPLLSTKNEGWVENMVKVATAANQLVRKNCCNLCHIYVDRQVEFEKENEILQEGERQATGSPTERLWDKMNKSLEVEVYRQFLFDESSVGLDLWDSALETAVQATTPGGTAAVVKEGRNSSCEERSERSEAPIQAETVISP